MRRLGLIFTLLFLPFSALAEDSSPLRALTTGDDSRGWEAVGRLDFAGQSFCTGALVAEDLVLTAAHCLFDKDSGARYAADQIQFLAGWRDGRAAAYRGARRVVVHPGFQPSGEDRAEDLALIELDRPIRNFSIPPYATGPMPGRGSEVGVVSYAHDRAERPALQDVCHVLGDVAGTLVLDCEVDFGSSGAPVFDLSGPKPRIVSVVSAKATAGTQPVSLGTSLVGPLAELMTMLANGGDGVFSRIRPTVTPMGSTEAGDTTGAKFIRP